MSRGRRARAPSVYPQTHPDKAHFARARRFRAETMRLLPAIPFIPRTRRTAQTLKAWAPSYIAGRCPNADVSLGGSPIRHPVPGPPCRMGVCPRRQPWPPIVFPPMTPPSLAAAATRPRHRTVTGSCCGGVPFCGRDALLRGRCSCRASVNARCGSGGGVASRRQCWSRVRVDLAATPSFGRTPPAAPECDRQAHMGGGRCATATLPAQTS